MNELFLAGIVLTLALGVYVLGRLLAARRKQARRQSTAEPNQLYRAVAEDTPVLICRFMTGGEITYVNDAYCKYFQKTREKLVGQTFLTLIPEEDREAVMANISSLTIDSPTLSHEHMAIAPDGRIRWQRWTNRAVFDEQGRALAYQSIGEDITERKRTETELRDARDRLESTLNALPDLLFEINREGRIVDYRAPRPDLLYVPPQEFLGKTMAEVLPQSAATIISESIEEAFETGRSMGATYALEIRGKMRWFELSIARTAMRDAQEVRSLTLVRDITDRKNAEEQASRIGRVLEHSLNEIYMFDTETLRFVQVNRGARQNLGYSMEELRDLTPLDIKPDMTPDNFAELIEPLREGAKNKIHFTTVHRRKDGTRYPVEVHLQLMRGAEPVFVAIILDITERARTEAQQRELEIRLRQSQKMEAIGQLAGGVAHDFNNLLTAILGNTEMLLSTVSENTETFREDLLRPGLEDIQAAGSQAAALTRQLLAFSRRAILRPEVLNPHRIVGEMEGLLRRLIGEHIRLDMDSTPGSGCVRADPGQIELIVINLAVNAADAMPDGGRLDIRVADVYLHPEDMIDQVEAMPGRHVALTVSDTGAGISSEVREHLFEPFFTTKPVGKGTGLGLATVFGSVKQMGGHIRVDSKVGVGSRFTVYLPMIEGREEVIEPDSELARLSPRETILVCEDEELVRNVLCQSLRAAGYSVIEAASGEQALKAAAGHDGQIELLISDVRMPGMTGTELADRLVAEHPDMSALLVSGYSADLLGGDRIDHYTTAFMQKPFGPADLLRRVREVLDEKNQHRRYTVVG